MDALKFSQTSTNNNFPYPKAESLTCNCCHNIGATSRQPLEVIIRTSTVVRTKFKEAVTY